MPLVSRYVLAAWVVVLGGLGVYLALQPASDQEFQATTPTTTLSASPNPCYLATGQQVCTTAVSWSSQVTNAIVWVSMDGGIFSNFACSPNGSQGATWIQANHLYEFRLYPATTCGATTIPSGDPLASALVTGFPEPKPSIGMNKIDLANQYIGTASGGPNPVSTEHQKVTQAMAKKAIIDARDRGFNYLRVGITGYAPSVYGRVGDVDLWRSNPVQYWVTIDKMMSDLAANNVKIVPMFQWNATQFAAMTNDKLDKMVTDPNSASYQLLKSYVTDFVTRYKTHPALYFYEVTSEMNLLADLDIVKSCGTLPRCNHFGNFTSDQMIVLTTRLATLIKMIDPGHIVSSGFSIPRPYAEHLRAKPEFAGGPDWTSDTVDQFKTNLKDIHQGLDLMSVHFYNGGGDNERFGNTGHTNAGLLDVVKQAADIDGKRLFVGEFGDAEPFIRDDRNALFTQSVLNKIVSLKIPFSAPWVWEFYQFKTYQTYDSDPDSFNIEPGYTDLIIGKIKDANTALGNYPPTQIVPDTVLPQVVLTWPLGASTVAGATQLLYAVASDNAGPITRVVFLVNGASVATVTTPPYQYTLNTSILKAGSNTIRARAFDAVGNQAGYAITVTKP